MTFATRTFCISPDETLLRVTRRTMARLWNRTAPLRIAEFAGQRIRFADVQVELKARIPILAWDLNAYICAFDSTGGLDHDAVFRPILARQVLRQKVDADGNNVVQAADKFVASGGWWTPSNELATLIYETALGNKKVPRL